MFHETYQSNKNIRKHEKVLKANKTRFKPKYVWLKNLTLGVNKLNFLISQPCGQNSKVTIKINEYAEDLRPFYYKTKV